MKLIRISFLLMLFVVAAFYTKSQRLATTSWVEPLIVSIYPINVDQRDDTARYIQSLTASDFSEINDFFIDQWSLYSGLDFTPFDVKLRQAISSQPPKPPSNDNLFSIAFWSIRIRFWAFRQVADDTSKTINVFIRYHQPNENEPIAHSLGLQKGLIGVVNGYAGESFQARNNVVIAHEILHTVGASDKYDLASGQPIFPQGFAQPDKQFKQKKAVLMAAKIPLSSTESLMPASLKNCIISVETATEITWIE
ncbi:MAG: hypothetical protein KBT50_08300 [Cycloclasticus sp.]|nr:hypothetical protein [Cycloclasticus sp.]MBQ0790603.1 hypothetical protein [Cycloclasticus sp.]